MKQIGTWRDIFEREWPVYEEVIEGEKASALMTIEDENYLEAGRRIYNYITMAAAMSEDDIIELELEVVAWGRDWYQGEDLFWDWLSDRCDFLPSITSKHGLYCRKYLREGFEEAIYSHVARILKDTSAAPLH
jgi:hypothetical protein